MLVGVDNLCRLPAPAGHGGAEDASILLDGVRKRSGRVHIAVGEARQQRRNQKEGRFMLKRDKTDALCEGM